MAGDSNALSAVVQSVIAAGSGLLGVGIGGLIASHNQKKERRAARIRQQLEGFYSPLLGMQKEIHSKSELRTKLHDASSKAWAKKLTNVQDPISKAGVMGNDWPRFAKVIEYSDEQLRKDLVPLYRAMLLHFRENLWLSERTTLAFFPALLEFVEIWNRFLSGTLPAEVLEFAKHEESALTPFYEDLLEQFDRLTRQLAE